MLCLQRKGHLCTLSESRFNINSFLHLIVLRFLYSYRSVEEELVEGENVAEEEREQGGKREKPVVRPEEIPPVPENRFLLRRDMPSQEDKTEVLVLKLS